MAETRIGVIGCAGRVGRMLIADIVAADGCALAGGVAPDGRRRFGSVRDAILAVLTEAGGEMRVGEIHERVEQLLGEPVPGSSVRMYLRRGCRRSPGRGAWSP